MSQQVVIFNNEFSMPSYEFLTTVIVVVKQNWPRL